VLAHTYKGTEILLDELHCIKASNWHISESENGSRRTSSCIARAAWTLLSNGARSTMTTETSQDSCAATYCAFCSLASTSQTLLLNFIMADMDIRPTWYGFESRATFYEPRSRLRTQPGLARAYNDAHLRPAPCASAPGPQASPGSGCPGHPAGASESPILSGAHLTPCLASLRTPPRPGAASLQGWLRRKAREARGADFGRGQQRRISISRNSI
jgi:hypothetical protein